MAISAKREKAGAGYEGIDRLQTYPLTAALMSQSSRPINNKFGGCLFLTTENILRTNCICVLHAMYGS